MTYLYSSDLVSKLKKRNFIYFLILISLFCFSILFETILIYLFSLEPYGTDKRIVYQIIMYPFAVLSVFGITFYIEIVFLKYRRYYNLIIDSVTSLRTTSDVTVLRINNDLNDKNGSDFTSFDVLEWSTIKNDYVERTISVDVKAKVKFNKDDMLKIVSANGVLLAYEVKNNEKK